MTLPFLFTQPLGTMLKLRQSAIWIVLAAACGLIAHFGFSVGDTLPADQRFAQATAVFAFHILALCSIIYTTTIVTQEVEQKTIVYLLTRPIARWRLLLGRYLASTASVVLLGLLSVAAAGIGAYGTSFLSHPLVLRDAVAVVFASAAYGALFLYISLLFNRAMIYCIIFAFAWETSIPNMPGNLHFLSIYSHMVAFAKHPQLPAVDEVTNFFSGSFNVSSSSSTTALVILGATAATLLAVSLWWFGRFEYSPRDDTE